jgi:hypothetical protein
MKLRFLSLTMLAASASALAFASALQAHDPSLHEPAPTPTKAKPATCAELADTQRYSRDLTDPDIKALSVRCEASKKAASSGKKTATPTDGKTK